MSYWGSVPRTTLLVALLLSAVLRNGFGVDVSITSPDRFILEQHERHSARLRGQAPESPPLPQLQTPRFEVSGAIPRDVFESRWDQLIGQGYRPAWLQGGAERGGEAAYSSIWLRDDEKDWQAHYDLTSAAYRDRIESYRASGHRLVCVSGYSSSGTARFAGVWIHEPDADYRTEHDLTGEQYESYSQAAVETGYAPRVIVGYESEGSARYACLFEPAPGYDWVADHDLPADEYEDFSATYSLRRYGPLSVTGYEIAGETYYAPIFVKDGLEAKTEALHHATTQEFLDAGANVGRFGSHPTCVSAYGEDGDIRLEAVFVDKERTWRATGQEVPALASLDSTIQGLMQARGIRGAVLAVTYKSRLVFARGYNWDSNELDTVYPDTLFRSASVGKSFTSAAIMSLVQDGKLSLSEPIVNLQELIPAPGETADSRLSSITVQRLLNHLGGWDRDISGDLMFVDFEIAEALGVPLPITQENIITYASAQTLDHAPGTQFAYCNYGYMLLGRIVEAVSGQSYFEYMQRRVLSPLGISRMRLGSTAFELRRPNETVYYNGRNALMLWDSAITSGSPHNVMLDYGAYNIENVRFAGGWLGSAVDIVRFATAFDETGGYPVLSPEFVETTFAKPEVGMGPGGGDLADGTYYAAAWFVTPTESGLVTQHAGDLPGTATDMVRMPDGLNWVILYNRGNTEPENAIRNDVARAVNAIPDSAWPAHDLFPEYNVPARRPAGLSVY